MQREETLIHTRKYKVLESNKTRDYRVYIHNRPVNENGKIVTMLNFTRQTFLPSGKAGPITEMYFSVDNLLKFIEKAKLCQVETT